MSKKEWFKGLKKAKLPESNPTPRSMDEIQKAYNEAVLRAGQAQYQVYVYSKDLEQANKALLSLNQEGAARQNMDKEAASTQPPPAATQSTQNEATNERS